MAKCGGRQPFNTLPCTPSDADFSCERVVEHLLEYLLAKFQAIPSRSVQSSTAITFQHRQLASSQAISSRLNSLQVIASCIAGAGQGP